MVVRAQISGVVRGIVWRIFWYGVKPFASTESHCCLNSVLEEPADAATSWHYALWVSYCWYAYSWYCSSCAHGGLPNYLSWLARWCNVVDDARLMLKFIWYQAGADALERIGSHLQSVAASNESGGGRFLLQWLAHGRRTLRRW